MARDTSERKRAEKALQHSEELLERAQKIAHLGSWELDLIKNKLTWSDEAYHIFGLRPRAFGATYEAFLERVHPDDRAAVNEGYSGSLRRGEDTYEIEHRIVCGAAEEVRWVQEKCEHIRDAAGKIVRSIGMVLDVTDRKRAEEAVERNGALLKAINRILSATLTCETEEDLGIACLDVAEELTQSKFGFIGEVGDKEVRTIAISGAGWQSCKIEKAGGRRKLSENLGIHGIYGQVLTEGKGLFVNDPFSHPAGAGLPAAHPALDCFLGAPLIRKGRTIGMIALANRHGGYTPGDQQVLETLAPAIVEAFVRKRAEDALRHSEERYQMLAEAAIEGIGISEDGRIIDVNEQLAGMYGYTREEMIGMEGESLLLPDERQRYMEHVHSNSDAKIQFSILRRDGQMLKVEGHGRNMVYRGRRVRITTIHDITDRKRSEVRQELTAGILRVLNQSGGELHGLIREVLRLIKDSFGFDAVGLRLRREDDYPYYEQTGFSDEFVQKENYLCSRGENGFILRDAVGRPVLECTCGVVLSGQTDPSFPFFTENGSFWTNCASDLLSIPIEDDPRINPRNRCVRQGYQSVALIPVRSGDEIVGLLQLNDRRKGTLTLESVRFLERIGGQIGLALRRIQAQEELQLLNQCLEQRVAERTAVAEQRSEQLQLLASELTIAEDLERQRIAEVLHDGLQQVLAAAKFQLATIERSTEQRKAISRVASMIDQAIETSRSLTAELSPPILYHSGLLAALQWLARRMQERHGFEVQLNIDESANPASDDIAVFLFQAIKELLFNAHKHARVRCAGVEVTRKDERIRVMVSDEGRGFDSTKIRSEGGTTGGFGLFRINERLTMLGGTMTINSSPGNGTTVELTAPARSTRGKPAFQQIPAGD